MGLQTTAEVDQWLEVGVSACAACNALTWQPEITNLVNPIFPCSQGYVRLKDTALPGWYLCHVALVYLLLEKGAQSIGHICPPHLPFPLQHFPGAIQRCRPPRRPPR